MKTELFCLHGFLGSASDWESAFSGSENVHAVDWLRDSTISSGANWNSLSSAVQSWSDARATTGAKKILLGYSMGGRIALQTLLQKPEAWDAAVIISAHPGLTNAEERAARIQNDQKWAKRFLEQDWNELISAWNDQPVFQGENNPLIREDSSEFRKALAHALVTWSLGTQPDFRPALSVIKKPILWIAGERDGKYAELARHCASLNPIFEYAIIPSAGHRAPWTATEYFQSLLKNWTLKYGFSNS